MNKTAVKRKSHSHHSNGHLKNRLNHIRKSLADLGHNIEKNTSSALTRAGRRSTLVKKDIDRFVTKKPYRSMGLLMLAGVCIGYIIHRHD